MRLTYRFLYDVVFIRFRRSRMNRFFALFSVSPETRVLDVGGYEPTWTRESTNAIEFPVTLINTLDYGAPGSPRFRPVIGNATSMPFEDRSFDIAFSNSVIEHVGTWEEQMKFAQEVRRVAPKLWVQTPARSFPIEAHLLAPYIQYLPKRLQHRIARWTPRGILQPELVHQMVDEVRLLTYKEMRKLFPDCVIFRERLLGLTKSYIAIRGADFFVDG
ncbi:MAG TPA: methyltransferase domain-containing protein [Terracidiphilus sp.]|jgi:SAM-dependent methyltransferase|nr:methyltransferase domain-containing protein [Terracidiphilus sp.]